MFRTKLFRMAAIGGAVYFAAYHPSVGTELWKCDGASVSLVQDVNGGTGDSKPAFLTEMNGKLFFRAYQPSTGYEWHLLDPARGIVPAPPPLAPPPPIVVTGIEEAAASDLVLEANYPNPFNPSTTILFSLPARMKVALRVHDLLGRTVAVLVEEVLEAGRHARLFDAAGLPSGIYICRLEAGGTALVRRMQLVK